MDELHSGIVDEHGFEGDVCVVFGIFGDGLTPETGSGEDISFVDEGDFLSAALGKIEGNSRDSSDFFD